MKNLCKFTFIAAFTAMAIFTTGSENRAMAQPPGEPQITICVQLPCPGSTQSAGACATARNIMAARAKAMVAVYKTCIGLRQSS